MAGCSAGTWLPVAGPFPLPAWAGHPASAVLRAGDACIQELILPPSGHCRHGMAKVGTQGKQGGVCGMPHPCRDVHTVTTSMVRL